MKSYKTLCALALVVLVMGIGFPTAAGAEDQPKNFNAYAAFSASWYPLAAMNPEWYGDYQTKTDFDLYNFNLSAIMNLKFFKKYGVYLDLKVDDPTFKKMLDIVSYINIRGLMLKFDYHAFGGNIVWDSDIPADPIPELHPIHSLPHKFRTQWATYSILFDLVEIFGDPVLMATTNDFMFAFGLALTTINMPMEYNARFTNPPTLSGDEAPKPISGFGDVKGTAWGLSLFWNVAERENFYLRGFNNWFYFNGIVGLAFVDYESSAVREMETVNGKAKDEFGDGGWGFFGRFDMIFGLNKTWHKSYAKLGLSFGINFLLDWFIVDTGGFETDIFMMNLGPSVRFSMRF